MVHSSVVMARILPDREINALLGKVILGGIAECVRINSYEVRLGHTARFDSTGEEVSIPDGNYLEIEPGDFVSVESLEAFDLSPAMLKSIGKPHGIFAWITPTTTMMREGFLFASTKVDPGYKGTLNWGIRNSSIKAVRLKQGERLFKLTLVELGEDEQPDRFYGEHEHDYYQNTTGIKDSARTMPVNVPDRIVVHRTQQKIDPIKQLAQAGYPFNHIGTELISIQGQFKVVSEDVAVLSNGMTNLGTKIENETKSLSTTISGLAGQIETGLRDAFREQFGLYFDQRMMRVYGTVAALVSFCLALYRLLIQSVPGKIQGYVLIGVGILILVGTLVLTNRTPKPSPPVK
jgi:deoxycytidine triphosphate deaminase